MINSNKKFILPNHIIPFKNPDKEFQEEPTNDLFMLPHSSRVCFYSTPSGGKTTTILNVIIIKIPIELLLYTMIARE